MKISDKKACPFCQSMKTVVVYLPGYLYTVACTTCKAQGPQDLNPEWAEKRWDSWTNPDFAIIEGLEIARKAIEDKIEGLG